MLKMKWVGNDTAEPPNPTNEARLRFQIGPPQPTPAYSVKQLQGFGLIGLYDPERQEDFRHALPILYDAKLAPDFTAANPSPPPE